MGRSHWRSFYRSLRRKIQRLFFPVCPKMPRRLSIYVYIYALTTVLTRRPCPRWRNRNLIAFFPPGCSGSRNWREALSRLPLIFPAHPVAYVMFSQCLGPKKIKFRLFLLTKARQKKLRKQHTATPVMSWQPPRSSTMLLPLALPTPSRLCMVQGIRLGLFAPPYTPFLVVPLTTPTMWQKQITRTTLSSEIPACMASYYPQIRSCRLAWRLLLGWSTCWKMRTDIWRVKRMSIIGEAYMKEGGGGGFLLTSFSSGFLHLYICNPSELWQPF